MKPTDIANAKDPDLRSAMDALRRAAALARKVAIDAGTELVIVRDGRLTLVDPVSLQPVASAEIAPDS